MLTLLFAALGTALGYQMSSGVASDRMMASIVVIGAPGAGIGALIGAALNTLFGWDV
jgi:hypothetical protein